MYGRQHRLFISMHIFKEPVLIPIIFRTAINQEDFHWPVVTLTPPADLRSKSKSYGKGNLLHREDINSVHKGSAGETAERHKG